MSATSTHGSAVTGAPRVLTTAEVISGIQNMERTTTASSSINPVSAEDIATVRQMAKYLNLYDGDIVPSNHDQSTATQVLPHTTTHEAPQPTIDEIREYLDTFSVRQAMTSDTTVAFTFVAAQLEAQSANTQPRGPETGQGQPTQTQTQGERILAKWGTLGNKSLRDCRAEDLRELLDSFADAADQELGSYPEGARTYMRAHGNLLTIAKFLHPHSQHASQSTGTPKSAEDFTWLQDAEKRGEEINSRLTGHTQPVASVPNPTADLSALFSAVTLGSTYPSNQTANTTASLFNFGHSDAQPVTSSSAGSPTPDLPVRRRPRDSRRQTSLLQ